MGVAFPHATGLGFNIELKAFPRDGKLVVLPPQTDSAGNGGAKAERAIKPAAAKERSR